MEFDLKWTTTIDVELVRSCVAFDRAAEPIVLVTIHGNTEQSVRPVDFDTRWAAIRQLTT